MDRNRVLNAFEFVALAGQRARQLMSGCVPRVAGPEKKVKVAEMEVATGAVQKVETVKTDEA
jgi:DNA-directed RNA polymerase subunit K/omega